jgi:ubiquinone/menaquinone biosynthesis C-methylase UbiE
MSHPSHRFDPANMHKLEDPARLQWLPPDAIAERIGLLEGMVAVDIGAGTGFFAIPMARRLGETGKVIALDVEPAMLERLRSKAEGLRIETVQGSAEATGLPDRCADLVLMANVWHELDDRRAGAEEARRVLRDGGRLAIVDWRPDCAPPPGPPSDHRIGEQQVAAELEEFGWQPEPAAHVGQYSYLILARPR